MNITQFKASIKKFFKSTRTPEKNDLYKAVEDGDIDTVKAILATATEDKVNLIYNPEMTNYHYTPQPVRTVMIEACYKGHEEILNLLLDSKLVDLNLKCQVEKLLY